MGGTPTHAHQYIYFLPPFSLSLGRRVGWVDCEGQGVLTDSKLFFTYDSEEVKEYGCENLY